MRTALRDITLAYDDQGQGVPLILIHGFPFSHRMWQQQVAAISRVCRLITVDLRGFGESTGTPDGLEQMADDVHGLVDHLRLSSFILGGFSMGGYVVFRYLARHTDQLRALLLLDTRAEPDSPDARERRFAGIDRITREGPAGFLDDFVKLLVSPRTVETRPEVVTQVRRMMDGTRVGALTGGLRAMAERPDSTPLLPTVRVPTLVVVGEDDKATPVDSSRTMAATIPHAELVIIPGAGHVSNVEQPDAFNAALVEFLTTLK